MLCLFVGQTTSTLTSVLVILGFTAVFWVVCAVTGQQLFAGYMPLSRDNFDNFGQALVTVRAACSLN